MELLKGEFNKDNVTGMKSEALAHRDKLLNEKAQELKRELEKKRAVVIASAVSSLYIPFSGAFLIVCDVMTKFWYVAKEMGLIAYKEEAARKGFATCANETYNEVLDHIIQECVEQIVQDIVPGLSLLKIPSSLAAHRQRVIRMIDTLHEKAKLCHEHWIDNQIQLLLEPASLQNSRWLGIDNREATVHPTSIVVPVQEPPISVGNTEHNGMGHRLAASASVSSWSVSLVTPRNAEEVRVLL